MSVGVGQRGGADFRAEDGLMVQLESGVASFEEAMSSMGVVFGVGRTSPPRRVRSVKRRMACRLPWASCGRLVMAVS